MFLRKNAICFFWVLWLLVLMGCGGATVPDYAKPARPLHEIYNDGLDFLLAGRFNQSIVKFQEVDQHYPYTIWSKRALLLQAYAHYQLGDCTGVLLQVTRYTQFYPADSKNPYAYYLKGRCYYDDMLLPGRDQGWTKQAEEQFQFLISTYPESVYAIDSGEKLYFVKSRLAGQELLIGRFYQKQKNYPAAIQRYRRVGEKYGNTLYVEEALYRLVESHLSMGLGKEALMYGATLGHNFPASVWYKKSYRILTERGLGIDLPAEEEGNIPIDEPTWERELETEGL